MSCHEPIQNQQDDPVLMQIIPAKMEAEMLQRVATWLAKWKSGDLSVEEAEKVEAFVFSWASQICELQGSRLTEQLSHAPTEFLILAMAELEYLIQQEIISRQLNYRTYTSDVDGFFDRERMSHHDPNFLRQYLTFRGFGIIHDDLSVAMTAIAKFLETSQQTGA